MNATLLFISCGLFLSVGQTGPETVGEVGFLRLYAETRGFMLGRPVRPQPTPDGRAVLFLRSPPRSAVMNLYEFDVATQATRELVTPAGLLQGAEETLSPEEKARRERMRLSARGFADFQLSDDGRYVLLTLSGRLYLLDRTTRKVRDLDTGPGTIVDPKFAPDGRKIAYVRDYDVWVLDRHTHQARAVTTGGTAVKSHGLAEFVAQEEMGRFSGYWWSPDSRFIAYEEADASQVETWYVADPAQPGRPPQPFFYPRPGKNNVVVRLGVVSVEGGQTTWVDWDSKAYPYLARVDWGEYGPLTILVQSRDQRQLLLLRVDPSTGQTQPLLQERDPAWVNLPEGVPRWLPDDQGFLWVSERDGGPSLEWRRPDGAFRRTLVPPDAGFRSLIDVHPTKGEIIYQASSDPTQAQIFRLRLDGSPPTALTHAVGIHSAVVARDHSLFVLQSVQPDVMPRSTVHQADGNLVAALPSVALSPPLTPRAEMVTVGSNPRFHAVVVRPRQFDPKRKYPVVVDVYGGPGHNHVTAAMPRQLLRQWLADQGFVVVALDNRGTPGRGRDWERAIHRRFATVPLDDQVAGLQALGQRFPELDISRVGIVGWSFGGYLAALAVLRRPDVFRAAVAGAPVVDWLDYDMHYTERYLGLPTTDAAAYKEASLLSYAPHLSRPLLIIHGTADDNVYFQHSLKLADALFRAGKDFELLPLSGLTHMVPEPVVTEQLWARIARFFRRHLGQ